MSYLTKVDLAKRAKIFSGDTANFDGSIKLSKDFSLGGVLTLSGVTQFTAGTYKALVIDDVTKQVFKTTINGDSGLINNLTVTSEDVGGISQGDFFVSGTTFESLWRKLLTKTYFPELIPPSLLLTSNYPNSLYEIGQILNNFSLTGNFDRGKILEVWVKPVPSVQGFRAGTAINYKFSGNTITIPNQPQLSNTYNHGNLTVVQGFQTFSSVVLWNEGVQPLDSEDNPYSTPLPTGSAFNQSLFEGVYPIFGSSSSITVSTKQPLQSMINGNNIEITLVPEINGNKQFFEMPSPWVSVRSIVNINYYNTVSQSYDLTNKLTDFTITDTVKNVNGNMVNYKKYTNVSPDRGVIKIKLIF